MGQGTFTWAITHRTTRGDERFDRHLSTGTLRLEDDAPDLLTALAVLGEALRAAEALAGPSPTAGGREPRGAVGGGPKSLRRLIEQYSGVPIGEKGVDW